MATTPLTSRPPARLRPPPAPRIAPAPPPVDPRASHLPAPKRIASNFLSLGAAEVACRGTSFLVTLLLVGRLTKAGCGRTEYAFSIVSWLVLLVRNGCEVIAARELARHPRLVRPLVNHLLFVKLALAAVLFLGLAVVGTLRLADPVDRTILMLYGLMLVTTAMGLDFVYRGIERMGLVAISLYIRTAVYAVGVWSFVGDPGRIVWVPAWLAAGEASGIALVWSRYLREYGLPRPTLSLRFLGVFVRRCKPVLLVQVAQTVLGSVDLLVVGAYYSWDDVGLYSLPHRMILAALTFGLIFQQAVFPTLARSWRDSPAASRRALNSLVRFLGLGLVPMAVGAAVLATPLFRVMPRAYQEGSLLLALGIWRAPLLSLAFLYHTTLIALNREAAGVRLLAAGAIGSAPLVALSIRAFGLAGASSSIVLIALALVVAGYGCLAREGRQPAWHHHLARPLAASAVMVPACLALLRFHVGVAIAGGAATYVIALALFGGLRRDELRAVFGRD